MSTAGGASRALTELILGHAVRERATRAIQQDSYDDAPITGLPHV